MQPIDPISYLIQSLQAGVYDPQAQYLYKAEEETFFPGLSLDQAMALPVRFKSSEEATKWARKMQTDPRVAALWPKFAASKPLNVAIGQLPYGAGARTEAETDDIEISNNGFGNTEDSVIHEMAHVIVHREYHAATSDMATDEGHGPLFTGIFLRLNKEIKGEEHARKLQEKLQSNNVEWRAI